MIKIYAAADIFLITAMICLSLNSFVHDNDANIAFHIVIAVICMLIFGAVKLAILSIELEQLKLTVIAWISFILNIGFPIILLYRNAEYLEKLAPFKVNLEK
jgi:intracellular septation protein A